jgi:hypothetical protein
MGFRSQSALAIAASTVGARHLESCLTSQGASLKHHPPPTSLHAPQTSTIIASARCPQAGSAAIRYSSFSTLQILFRVLSAHKSSILSSASLLTCERIDLAQHQPPTLHLGADALERSRHHLIHDEHKPFQVDAKQLDVELALTVNPIYQQTFS